jgi:starch synthase
MQSNKRQPGMSDLKRECKVALQEQLGWPAEPRRPMLCLPSGMSEKLGGALFQEVLPGLLTLPVEILVVGRGSATYGSLFTKLAKEHRHRVHIVLDKDAELQKMYEASDMALFLSDPKGLAELSLSLSSGMVPVSLPTSLLDDYDPVQESGNAFLFESANAWQCFAALVRAIETYKLPFDWRTIQRHGMETAGELS